MKVLVAGAAGQLGAVATAVALHGDPASGELRGSELVQVRQV